jgi:DNA polymerase
LPIRWNWSPRPDRIAFVDFETASVANLREVGSFAYVRDASTRLLSAVFKVDGVTTTWVPRPPKGLDFPGLVTGTDVPEVIRDLAKSHVWIAHNAEGFDALLWEALYPDVCPEWLDTLPLAKAAGLPGGIDALSRSLGGTGKDDEGRRALMLLTKAKFSKGKVSYNLGTKPLWKKLLDYNVKDVEDLERVYKAVTPVSEPRLLTLHSRINDRGVRVDVDLARKLFTLWDEAKGDARDRVAELTNGELDRESVRSNHKVHRWLKTLGIELGNLRREELELVFQDPESLGVEDDVSGLVIEVLSLRSLITRTAEGKVSRLLDTLDGDRLRYLFTFHAAATGRFSSRGVQVHNLPRGASGLDVERLLSDLSLSTVRAEAEKLGVDVGTILNTLLRLVFLPDSDAFSIADFAAIEARGVAWIAGEEGLLKSFSDPRSDVYCAFGSTLFGRPITKKQDPDARQVSKIIILGSGYGMGAARFEAFCKTQQVDLAGQGLTGRECIQTYRRTYASIPAIWRGLETTALAAVKGVEGDAGRCNFRTENGSLVVTLPSGRRLTYREARIVRDVPIWAKVRGISRPPEDMVFYRHPHGYEKNLYGGLLTENVVQAIARDLLGDAMLRADEELGLDTRLHVHDEIVTEGDRIEDLVVAMSTPPPWASGFPVLVEGFTCPRYSKAKFRGSREAVAIDGRLLA